MGDYQQNEDWVKAAWQHFMQAGVIADGIRPLVAASWKRCFTCGLNPNHYSKAIAVEQAELARRTACTQRLLTTAIPIMEELHELVKGSGFLTLLTDADGVILHSLTDPEARSAQLERNLIVGAVWKENCAGTSAIGMALLSGKPVQIVGAEHYFAMDHAMTCSAAPIFDHDGKLAGALNMSGLKEMVHPHTLGMVVAGSKAVTQQLVSDEDRRQIWLANEYLKTVIESIADGVVAIDAAGRIREINSEAARILSLDVTRAHGQNLHSLFAQQPFWKRLLESGQSVADMETVIDTEQGHIHCHTSARPIRQAGGQIVGAVATLKETRKLHRVVNQIVGAEARFSFKDIIGQSSAMLRTIHLAQIAARNVATVLLQGESGTGKELFAQAIHNAGLPGQPFVVINCAAIPETLIESELFGYEGGAFTGASRSGRPGKFELANGGTIFLDEIGEMPLNVQAVLLRVLQERAIERVGGLRTIPVNVRVIAATNKNLEAEVRKENFRQDLYYRLNVFKIDIPPLRERVTDLPLLVDYLALHTAGRLGKLIRPVAPAVLKLLAGYTWPGNVRQLENVIERAVHLAEHDSIEEQHLPDYLLPKAACEQRTVAADVLDLRQREKDVIAQALKLCGDRQKTAETLGISRSTLYRRLKKYGQEETP